MTTPLAMTDVTSGPQDAGRQQRELVLLAAEDDGVSGVVAAQIADDDVVPIGQQVDDLALGLIAPLEADDGGDVLGLHVRLLPTAET